MPAQGGVKITIDSKKLDELIRISGNSVTLYVADGVEYGVYQEFTSRGHPSLRPAFERVKGTAEAALRQAIERNVNLKLVLSKMAFDIQRLWAADVNVDTGALKNSIHVETDDGKALSTAEHVE